LVVGIRYREYRITRLSFFSAANASAIRTTSAAISLSFTFFTIFPFMKRRPSPCRRDPHVRLARLARAVHGAPHYSDLQGDRQMRQAPLHLGRDLDDVDRHPPAGGARDEFSGPLCRSPRDFRIPQPTRISSSGGPVSDTRKVSPIPSARRTPIPTDDLIVPEKDRPRLRDADVQRKIEPAGEEPVRVDRGDDVGGFQENFSAVKRAFSQIFRYRAALATRAFGVGPPYFASRSFRSTPR